ncbi:hypothetical protein BRCON_2225 [Candidatus Sumerlaea chitinivorans]|uniref:Uncharacterized protein n=1 Tax=Sumerlaea chitinivorans TaxID=2250252 RepID=A0A2Z4Y8K5_SUMC1|nr:hypothetical protein BRCON_2225 [Candidatus Sumerlaea chitinivorans]
MPFCEKAFRIHLYVIFSFRKRFAMRKRWEPCEHFAVSYSL